MGGDHKCPVCQATFTRPQHVARHMRSHTGDRPYKCQHCGDQFARSDLLSRHINKCHANEKVPPTQGSRRKGSASASRATTSKQACDQCVQSSLPCDGSNPCAKCIQRKCRCTYVKFHRQTAPVGPGHNPRPTMPSNGIPNPPAPSVSSSRIPISYSHPDDFFLGPPPPSSVPTTMAESLYNSQTFAFPPLYPDPSSTASSTDFTSKYRAQAELLRNGTAPGSHAHFTTTNGTGGPVGPGIPGSSTLSAPGIYSDLRSASGGSSWVSWSHGQEPPDSYHNAQQESLHDKDMHGHDSLSHHSHPQQHHHQYVNSHGTTHGLQHLPSGAGTYPHQAQASAAYLRRGSVEFGDSDGSSSAAEHSSVPSSADSSSVHLPLDNLTLQQAQSQHTRMLSYNALGDLSTNATDYAGRDLPAGGNGKMPTGLTNQSGLNGGEPGFSSALGLMSLDDPNVLSGLAADGASFFPNMNMDMGGLPSLSGLHADDPDATPMPLKETSASQVSIALPMRSASTSALNTNGIGSGTTPREVDMKEMRDFWKLYMRTPLSGPGPAAESQPGANSSQQHQQQQHQLMSPPGPRRPRVASMPSSKTPTVALSFQNSHQHPHDDADREGESGVRTTLHEDLRSYEAAVLARKAPTNLSLAPKTRRGTIPVIGHNTYCGPTNIAQGGSPVVAGKGIGVVPSVKLDLLRQSAGTDPRPSSTSTTHSGSPSESSLAGAFGAHQQRQHLQGSPHLSSFAQRRGSPASSAGDSSSRASSVSVDQEGDTDDDAASGESGRVGRLRPAFKRLASQTLGPPNAKRAFLVPSATMGGDVKEQQELLPHEPGVGVDMGGDEYGQGYAPGTLGMH